MVTAVEGRDAITGIDAGTSRASRGSRFTDVRWFDTTGSTNEDVMRLLRDGEPEGIVVVADEQTAGRGRAGRTWTAPPGASLLCTILLRPPASVAPLVTTALAVAAAQAIEQVSGFSPGLKWPNDLVVESDDGTTRKLAGILAEAEWPVGSHAAGGYRPPGPDERVGVAAGIGINVDWPPHLPEELADIATAINHVTSTAPDRRVLLDTMLDRFDHTYAALVTGSVGVVLDEWRRRSATLGRRVRVDLGAEELVGQARAVTDEGHLVVRFDDGEERMVAVGDVVHLRSERP